MASYSIYLCENKVLLGASSLVTRRKKVPSHDCSWYTKSTSLLLVQDISSQDFERGHSTLKGTSYTIVKCPGGHFTLG